MGEQICQTCSHWKAADFGGNCSQGHGFTSPGFSCGAWGGKGTMQPAVTDDGFDLEAAALKVLKARPPTIDISTVRDIIKCQYSQAQEVINYMLANDMIGKA